MDLVIAIGGMVRVVFVKMLAIRRGINLCVDAWPAQRTGAFQVAMLITNAIESRTDDMVGLRGGGAG